MRIPGWEKIASGERKLNQKEPTMTFTPREDFLPRADCGVPGFKLEDHERIVGGVEARPHQFPWQVGLFFDGYFCGGSIICKFLSMKRRFGPKNLIENLGFCMGLNKNFNFAYS